jgi:hypothetical protein
MSIDLNTLVTGLNALQISNHKLEEVRTQIADLITAYENKEIKPAEFAELANNIKVEAVVIAENQEAVVKQYVAQAIQKAISIVSHIT